MYTPKDPIIKTNLMLDLISQRQRALSTNLANMDTPNYVRKDISFDQYLGTMNNPLETELSIKLGPSGLIRDSAKDVHYVRSSFKKDVCNNKRNENSCQCWQVISKKVTK